MGNEGAATFNGVPGVPDVTVKSPQPRFLFLYLSLTVFHGSNHGSNSVMNRDDFAGIWTRVSARISGCRIIALGVWTAWKHVFNVQFLHIAFKSEVRSILKLPIGARKIPATGAQGARTLRPAWPYGRVVPGRLTRAQRPISRQLVNWPDDNF